MTKQKNKKGPFTRGTLDIGVAHRGTKGEIGKMVWNAFWGQDTDLIWSDRRERGINNTKDV